MENEEYFPEKKKFCSYKNAKQFTPDFLKTSLNEYNKIYICPYSINFEGKEPFLMFLLTTTEFDELIFQEVLNDENITSLELLNYSKVCLYELIDNKEGFEDFTKSIAFDGFFEYDNNLYIYFNITNVNMQINEDFIHPKCLVIIDEIVNVRTVCNTIIHSDVSDLFIQNEELCFLYNENNESYEIPIVSYVDKPQNKTNFTYVFRETVQNEKIFGPYYYFTNYSNAIDNSIKNNNKGLIRFALFIGVTKYVENNPNDELDLSEIKQLKMKENELETLTLKITDYDGTWSKQYDSVYLHQIKLDNGKYYDEMNVLAIKSYEQQVPLSYHYV